MTARQAQNVQINLTIRTTQNGHTNQYSFQEHGQIITIGDQLYLRYQETNSQQKIKVLFKISADNLLTIKRAVDNQPTTRLVFSRQHDQMASYPTEYGDLALVTHTKKMRLVISKIPLTGEINLEYSLRSQNNLVGDYKLRLIFKG
ncbi:DUF1934 domain-containing protein [Bombilactobacillus bombi]|uniref:DUF1934 domain-containing protein n=1 Tax=Bombilactobacillus bombi TaxID=1303590 RepID=UPI0015E5BD63|nr:DUF1934 domain-containing protein [Bombilactobacillus bombi]MBA1434254.1 DUF1934 domain-containing protein [Bombilactobacillus bombi]